MPSLISQVRSSIDGKTLAFFARINLFGLGLLGLWTAIDTTLLPSRVNELAPSSLTGSAVGLVSVVGVGLAMIVQPVAGRLSDAWPGDDTRRPFILIGLAMVIPGLILFGAAQGFVFLLVGFVLMQLATNVAQAAFQALIPDLVDEKQRGAASAVKNTLSVLGAAAGLLGAQGLYSLTGSIPLVLVYLGVLIVGTGLLTVRWTPKSSAGDAKQRPTIGDAINVRAMLSEFRKILKTHRTFRLGVAAQFFFLLGTYPAQRFLLLFLRDRFGSGAAERASIGGVAAIRLAIVGAGVAGALSDVIGRKNVLIGSVIVGASGLIAIGFSPALGIAGLAGGLIALGLGAFQSVNWALMNDDLPPGQSASALGVANIATAGAGTVAGLFGPLVDAMNAVFPQGTYQTLFALSGIVALISLAPLRRVAPSSNRMKS